MLLHLSEDARGEFLFIGGQSARPCAVILATLSHFALEMRPRFQWHCYEDIRAGQMMLEGRALLAIQRLIAPMQEVHEAFLAIVSDSVAQDQILHATTDVDGIDLHIAEMQQRVTNTRKWRV